MAERSPAGSVSDGSTVRRIHNFKLVLLGEASVGKSSLVLRFVKDQFRDALESTIGGKLNTPLSYLHYCVSYEPFSFFFLGQKINSLLPLPTLPPTSFSPSISSFSSLSPSHPLRSRGP